jgi:hypothetical protein
VRRGRCLMSFAVNGLMVLTHIFSEFSIESFTKMLSW